MPSAIVIGLLIALIILFFAGIRIIRPLERGLIERLGRYKKFAEPGFHWIIPIIDRMVQVNITETLVNAEPQEIITKDNLNATVDAQVYFKVKADEVSVRNSIYNVNDYELQITNLARSTLRNIIGNMSLKEANSERSQINKELMDTLEEETKNWGIEVVRTELKEINPPKEVQDTMNKIVIAENEKTSAIDFATARETEADGFRRAEIMKAGGEAQAIKIKAEAQAIAIKTVNEAASKYFVGNAQKLKQLEITQASLEKNSKFLIVEKGLKPALLLGEDLFKGVRDGT